MAFSNFHTCLTDSFRKTPPLGAQFEKFDDFIILKIKVKMFLHQLVQLNFIAFD